MNTRDDGRNMPERAVWNGSFDPMAVLDEEDREMIFDLASTRLENQRLIEQDRCRTVRVIERDRAEAQVALAEISHQRQTALENHMRDRIAIATAAQMVDASRRERPDCNFHRVTVEKREPGWFIFSRTTAWSVTLERHP